MMEATSFPPSFQQLFKKYAYQVSVSAVLEGNLKGVVFVDDLDEPCSGLMLNSEGAFIAGDPSKLDFNSSLSLYLEGIIQSGVHPVIPDTDDLWFYIDDPSWVKQYSQIFTSRDPFKVGRYNYTITLPAGSLRDMVSQGYTIQQADTSLDIDLLSFPDDVWGRIKDSLPGCLDRGFGVVLTQGSKVISWSNADCSSGDRCEIGIITTEEERRKGYGSLTVLAALDNCYRMGFKEVGWHCEAHNWGSIATAEKVGFRKKLDYYAWVCKFDLKQHLKEKPIVEKYYP